MQGLEAVGEIDVIAAEATLGENDGELGGKLGFAEVGSIDHHAREARRQRQTAQPLSFVGDTSVAVDGAEREQQRPRLRQRRRRRWIEEGKRRGLGDPPKGEVEHEARQIRGKNFRLVGGLERGRLRLVPQPVAYAGLGASGPPPSLVRGGARHAHGFKSGQPHVGFVPRNAREPGIDHHAHPLDGERGLRDRGRQHDLPPAGRGRRDRAILNLCVERTIKRHHIDVRLRDTLAHESFGAPDLGGARQKDQ